MIKPSEKATNGETINVAIAGIGNCASAFIQGLQYYSWVTQSSPRVPGLMHNVLGEYSISAIKVVVAFDVDKRKIGKDLCQAIYAGPNCTDKICDLKFANVTVQAGARLDGVAPGMEEFFCPIDQQSDQELSVLKQEIVLTLQDLKVKVLINYMPVGSQKATEFYAQCALEAGCAFINCMPVFIASNPEWIKKFEEAGLPLLGDDVKSQLGATITHRSLLHLYDMRGLLIKYTSQINYGGNTDFANMARGRLESKVKSKTTSCLSNIVQQLDPQSFQLIPSGYVKGLDDNKICNIKIKALKFGDRPVNMDMELEVVDSYNSAGEIVDAVRVIAIMLDRKIKGIAPESGACSFFFKNPRRDIQMPDEKARDLLEKFINDGQRNILIAHSRTKHTVQSGDEFSEVWTNILDDALVEAKENNLHLEVMAPSKSYHDCAEFVNLVGQAVGKLNSLAQGYQKNLFIPFGVTDKNQLERLITILENFSGNIFAINVEPTEEIKKRLPKIKGYIGMDNAQVGDQLFEELFSRAKVSTILVVRHQKNNYSLDQRIAAIQEKAAEKLIEVKVLYDYEHRSIKKILLMGNVGVITMGNRATEKILDLKIDVVLRIVAMDSNERIIQEAENGKRVIAYFSQRDLYRGYLVSGEKKFIPFTPIKSP